MVINPHAVTQVASSVYSYDNNGNLTNDGTWTHAWTYDNRLASSTNGIITVNYQYDQDGNRISKTTGTSTNYYINQFYELDNGVPAKHIFAGNNKVATVKATTTPVITYTSTDHLTGTSVETDSTGSPIEVIDYYPFGSVRIDEKTSNQENHYKYTGKELDPETNLYYYGARYYNSDIGRFVGIDPAFYWIGQSDFEQKANRTLDYHLINPQSLNSYSYVNNNPLKYTDPNGEIIPVLLVSWAVAEFGLSAYDAFDLVKTFLSDASTKEKGITLGGFVLGTIAPGGGYGKAGKMADNLFDTAKASGNTRNFLLNNVGDEKLKNIISELYRSGAKIGDGGTADVLRYEAKTGILKSPSGHLIKSENKISELNRYLQRTDINSADRNTAQGLLNDLNDAVSKAKKSDTFKN